MQWKWQWLKNIKVQVNAPESLAQLQLPVESRHNIYLLLRKPLIMQSNTVMHPGLN